MAILTLTCGGAAPVPESAYFVCVISRTDILVGDLPPLFTANLYNFTLIDGTIASWQFPNIITAANGVWNIGTTYSIGDTVESNIYSPMPDLDVSGNRIWLPVVYRSLTNGNSGNNPDNFTGEWTMISQPSNCGNGVFPVTKFGYKFASFPSDAELFNGVWTGGMGHSLRWFTNSEEIFDIVELADIYIRLNYRLASGILHPVESRPVLIDVHVGNQSEVLNPGPNATFRCRHTSGLSDPSYEILGQFAPGIISGSGTANGGQVGQAYVNALTAAGGTLPYLFSLISGSFPEGVTLDPLTGIISGIPLNDGVFSFTAKVTDSALATATVTCGMTIIPAPLPPPIPLFPFEFYEMQTPEDVETLPVPKKYDQLGPTRFDKIGKIFGFRIRLIVTGTTTTMPYKIYGDDSESLPNLNSPFYTGEFPVVPNVDKVYEIQLPKSVNTDVFRLSLGPVEDPFHRYDVLIKVHTSGLPGQARWIPVR